MPPGPFVTSKSTPSESHRVEVQGGTAGGGAPRAAQGWEASDVGLVKLEPGLPLSMWTRLTVCMAPQLDTAIGCAWG